MTTSLNLMLLFALATLIIAIDGVVRPERRYLSLVFLIIGVLGTLRQYRRWRRDRASGAS